MFARATRRWNPSAGKSPRHLASRAPRGDASTHAYPTRPTAPRDSGPEHAMTTHARQEGFPLSRSALRFTRALRRARGRGGSWGRGPLSHHITFTLNRHADVPPRPSRTTIHIVV